MAKPLQHVALAYVAVQVAKWAVLHPRKNVFIVSSILPDLDFLLFTPILGRVKGHRTITHYLRIFLDSPGKIEPMRYWNVNLNTPVDISIGEAAQQLQEVFLGNIHMHLRSDVPVGVSLSGGIDSSSILAAVRIIQGQGVQIPTFSYIADDPVLNEEHWVEI
ncbi:asparagine synthase-related protein, partial [Patescibacteria group bacterium]|nr:asparagine synthase-related protein [Patescibacteria group bacterium]